MLKPKSSKPKKILCIVGPTGTGKTALAIHLSKIWESTLISADSRQLYKGLDIVVGKDHPRDVIMHGIDLCNPSEDYSVSQWYNAISKYLANPLLPVVVGGTGLYINSLINPPETLHVPVDQALRVSLGSLSTSELVNKLQELDNDRFAKMNNSDANNPRRLIRAIEVEIFRKENRNPERSRMILSDEVHLVGLLPQKDPNSYKSQIKNRVISRLNLGAIEETVNLLKSYPTNLPCFTAIGYRSIIALLDGRLTKDQLITTWTDDEYAYARRQLLYLQKIPNINWYSCDEEDLLLKVEKDTKTWYDDHK